MAIIINKAITDGASSACFEVVSDGADAEDVTVIDVSTLSGAGDDDNQAVIIKKVFATVVNTAGMGGATWVTLSWGDGTPFLHLPAGLSEVEIPFEHNNAGGANADVVVTSSGDTAFTLRIFANKMTGFPLSMGHARNRP